jgi:hypothetical protein
MVSMRSCAVTRYYFHLHNDVEAPDPDGVDIRILDEARAMALRNARFTAAETIIVVVHFVGDHRIDIEDKDGTVLDTIYFKEAVKVEA